MDRRTKWRHSVSPFSCLYHCYLRRAFHRTGETNCKEREREREKEEEGRRKEERREKERKCVDGVRRCTTCLLWTFKPLLRVTDNTRHSVRCIGSPARSYYIRSLVCSLVKLCPTSSCIVISLERLLFSNRHTVISDFRDVASLIASKRRWRALSRE